jgi:cobalt-zinc-cadmium efflux system outer membrane protein
MCYRLPNLPTSTVQDDRTTRLNALNSYAQTWLAVHQLSFASATEVVP